MTTTSTSRSTAAPETTWYDVLDVSVDASADEVRAAWRRAIVDLEPSEPRFAELIRAGEVLLDPARRAAYDEEMVPDPDPEPDADPAPARRLVPGWLLIGLAVAVLVVSAASTWLAETRPSDRAVEDATAAARSAAEQAVVPLLSYDAHHLDESRAAAEQYLTSDYRRQYDQVFDGIVQQNAPATGTVLTADLVRSAVVRSGDDRVQVFVLVDQTRTNKADPRPQVYKNWVTMTMQDVDGDWLVAGLDT